MLCLRFLILKDQKNVDVSSLEHHMADTLSVRLVQQNPHFFSDKIKNKLIFIITILNFTDELQELNWYLKFLFDVIVDRGPSIGLNVTLNRYDLFHGHLFLAVDSGRLGIL